MNKNILQQTQYQRDIELSSILQLPFKSIQELKIASPNAIRVYDKNVLGVCEAECESLYKKYKYLDLSAYLKTLMYTSIKRRHKELIDLLKVTTNKICLDYGSGVCSHAIALLEKKNKVSILDVKESELMKFGLQRIKQRNYKVHTYTNKSRLPKEYFDLIICTDVLEHVYNPHKVLLDITNTLKQNGTLHLQVSNMIKSSSGHFKMNIDKYKRNCPLILKTYYKKTGQTIYKKL